MNPWRDTPVLSGRHVTLRPLREDDADALGRAAAGLTDLFFANVSNFADPEAAVAAALRERDHGRAMPFTVATPDGAVVGLTRFMRMHEGHRRVEIGGTFYAPQVQRTVTSDLNGRERLAMVPLVLLIVVLGVFPRPMLSVIEPAVQATMTQVGVTDPQPKVSAEGGR